jgi:GNAT superfamily N-acetyltransferase
MVVEETRLKGKRFVQRVSTIAAGSREEHGPIRATGLLILRALARLTGSTVLACLHKPVAPAGPSAGRLLTCQEIERAVADTRLDLPPGFVASQPARCFGVVVDDQVRCYAWTSSEQVRAVPGASVKMPPDAVYVFKAFTDPVFRRRGLLRECLTAVEQDAARQGRNEMTALVELHNRSSLQAFGNAGFKRCGFVVVLGWPWAARRIACRAAVPCSWCKHDASARASLLRSAVAAFARRF